MVGLLVNLSCQMHDWKRVGVYWQTTWMKLIIISFCFIWLQVATNKTSSFLMIKNQFATLFKVVTLVLFLINPIRHYPGCLSFLVLDSTSPLPPSVVIRVMFSSSLRRHPYILFSFSWFFFIFLFGHILYFGSFFPPWYVFNNLNVVMFLFTCFQQSSWCFCAYVFNNCRDVFVHMFSTIKTWWCFCAYVLMSIYIKI